MNDENDNVKDESGNAPAGDTATTETAAAETAAEGFLEPKDVEVGKSYKFFNTQVHTLRCPYSGARFPAGNFTPEEVTVNQWIKCQVDSLLIRAQK